MENNNKVLVGLVIFLSIWLCALSGFIVYDKILDKKEEKQTETPKQDDKDNSSTTTPVKEDHSVILNGGWYTNDADVIKVNYESVKNEGTVNGLNIKYKKDYSAYEVYAGQEGYNREESYDDVYTINNKITFTNARLECGSKNTILLVDNYIIIYSVTCNGSGRIEIYDKSNNLIIRTYHGSGNGETDVSKLEPVIHNKKIYYYGDYMEGENIVTGIKYIDLTQSKLVEKEVER